MRSRSAASWAARAIASLIVSLIRRLPAASESYSQRWKALRFSGIAESSGLMTLPYEGRFQQHIHGVYCQGNFIVKGGETGSGVDLHGGTDGYKKIAESMLFASNINIQQESDAGHIADSFDCQIQSGKRLHKSLI